MIIKGSGFDVKISKPIQECNLVDLTFTNEDEKTHIEFPMDSIEFEHTAEQFISALFNYNEDMAHRLYQEYGNVSDLKEEIKELKDKLHQTRLMLASHSDEFN